VIRMVRSIIPVAMAATLACGGPSAQQKAAEQENAQRWAIVMQSIRIKIDSLAARCQESPDQLTRLLIRDTTRTFVKDGERLPTRGILNALDSATAHNDSKKTCAGTIDSIVTVLHRENPPRD